MSTTSLVVNILSESPAPLPPPIMAAPVVQTSSIVPLPGQLVAQSTALSGETRAQLDSLTQMRQQRRLEVSSMLI